MPRSPKHQRQPYAAGRPLRRLLPKPPVPAQPAANAQVPPPLVMGPTKKRQIEADFIPCDPGDEDPPLPPPASVLSLQASIDKCGPGHCGSHHHPNVMPGTVHQCSMCSGAWFSGSLHAFPCGHVLCLPCLEDHVDTITKLVAYHAERINATLDEMACVEDLLYADNGPTDDYYAAETFTKQVRNQMGALKASIDSRIGFTCCGQPTNLGQFMQCMRPAVARTLWLCERWASTPLENRRACGWPDCRQFLPWECAWTDHKASDLRRWYCWQCKGNSVDAGHCLTETQECFPYLPEGQPALKPGR